ncbi:hypothetical protein [Dongia sp.]|uniref:hypothetical protein n=1 Tax=Dongia sp. TaxID=1977262 RepID=UPI0035AF817C
MPTIEEIVERVLSKHRDKVVRFHDDIPSKHVEAFKCVFGKTPTALPQNWTALANRYYDRIRNDNRWLGCDCRDSSNGDVPRLTTVEGRIVRRMEGASHEPHTTTCAFYRGATDHASYSASYSGGPVTYILRSNFRERGDARAAVGVKRLSKRKPANGLQRIMWDLLARSRRNEIYCSPSEDILMPSREQEVSALTQAISQINLDGPNGRVPLIDVLSFSMFSSDRFSRKIREMPWHNDMRPQGFLLGYATGHRPGFVEFGKRTIQIDGKISVFGEQVGETVLARPPYLALVSVAQLTRNNPWVGGVAAYLHPIMSSEHWCPVDSDAERVTLRCLFQIQYELARMGMKSTIRKPLFNMNPVHGNGAEVLIPDFEIKIVRVATGERASVLIETMGYADAWYHDTKAAIHRALEQNSFGRVIPFNAFDRPRSERTATEFDAAFVSEALKIISFELR